VTGPLEVSHRVISLCAESGAKIPVRVTFPSNDGRAIPGQHAWMAFDPASAHGIEVETYDELLDHLASHGIVTVTIDSGESEKPARHRIELAAERMGEAIELFLAAQARPGFELGCLVDPRRLALGGHRFGAAVAMRVPPQWESTSGIEVKAIVGDQGVDPISVGASDAFVRSLPTLALESVTSFGAVSSSSDLLYQRATGEAWHVIVRGSFDVPFAVVDPYLSVPRAQHRTIFRSFATGFLRTFVRDAAPSAADLMLPMSISNARKPGFDTNWLVRWHPKDDSASVTPLLDASLTQPFELEGSLKVEPIAASREIVGTNGAWTIVRNALRIQWSDEGGALVLKLGTGGLGGRTAIVFDTKRASQTPLLHLAHEYPLELEVTDTVHGKVTVHLERFARWVTSHDLAWRMTTVGVPIKEELSPLELDKAHELRWVAPKTAGSIVIDRVRIE